MIIQIFTKTYFILCQIILLFVSLWQKTNYIRTILNFPECRFYPNCSTYFKQAIIKHGLAIGITLGIKRIFKCHPLCEGGIDEVPS